MRCDVIIPAFNNSAVIAETLSSLSSQSIPAGWSVRVLVSDDGSSDDTLAIVERCRPDIRWPVVVIQGPHGGPAAARNRALDKSDADIIYFLGADIILKQQSFAAHLSFHADHPAPADAALGFVVWDPRLPPSPLMEWSIHGGPQNDYDALLGCRLADPAHFFYGANLSLKRSLIGSSQFSAGYTFYGWEDLDFGRELKKKGLSLHVLPNAIGFHKHVYSALALKDRQKCLGRGLLLYQKRYPDEHLLPQDSLWRHLRHQLALLSPLPWLLLWLLRQKHFTIYSPRLFQAFCSLFFWSGRHSRKKPII